MTPISGWRDALALWRAVRPFPRAQWAFLAAPGLQGGQPAHPTRAAGRGHAGPWCCAGSRWDKLSVLRKQTVLA